jgi:hypothetical protein
MGVTGAMSGDAIGTTEIRDLAKHVHATHNLSNLGIDSETAALSRGTSKAIPHVLVRN